MTWNYRVLSEQQAGETFYGIHEVFYDASGKIWGCTVDPVTPIGETPEDLKAEIEEYLRAEAPDAAHRPPVEVPAGSRG